MPEINKKKLELYTNKLYRGLLERYKEDGSFSFPYFIEEESKGTRIKVSVSQEFTVLENYSHKCVICGKPYDKDGFKIHHINGDSSFTVTKNLVSVCHRCHKKINRAARAKLKDYKVRTEDDEWSNVLNNNADGLQKIWN